MSENDSTVRTEIQELLGYAERGSLFGREELGKQFDEMLSNVLRVANDRLLSARYVALSKGVEFDLNGTMYEMIEQATAGKFITGLHPWTCDQCGEYNEPSIDGVCTFSKWHQSEDV